MSESLKDKVVKGAFWNGTERVGTALLLFVSNIILARLLSPDDFGCIGMLMVFISISEAIVDGGFGAALVQKKDASSVDYSTIFYWNIAVSFLLYLLLYIASPTIASFYKMEPLSSILRVQGLVLLFNGLSIIQRCLLQKQLLFKNLAKVNLVATLVGTALGIVCAYIGWGVWSLVVKFLSTSVMICVVLWLQTAWHPIWAFSRKSFSSLFKYGSFMFLTSITNSLYQNAISLIIGKSLSPATLGYFTQARKLEDIPRQSLTSIINNVTFPAFSMIQYERERLLKAFRKSLSILAYLNFSLTVLLILISKPVILLLFSEKWSQSIPYFQVICVAGFIVSIIELNQQVLKGTGNSNLLFWAIVVRRVLAIVLIVIGALGGMKGILLCYVIGQYISFIIVAFPLKNIMGYSILHQARDLMPYILLSVVAGGMVFCIMPLWESANSLQQLLLTSSVYIFMCVVFSHLLKVKGYIYVKEIIIQKFRKR